MTQFILKDAVFEEASIRYHDGTKMQVRYLHKEKLWATKCDACGEIFHGQISARNGSLKDGRRWGLRLHMTKTHENEGSSLLYDICSAECGLGLANGSWAKVPYDPPDDDLHPFVAIRAKVKSYELEASSTKISKRKLLKMWNDSAALPNFSYKEKEVGQVQLVGGACGGAVRLV